MGGKHAAWGPEAARVLIQSGPGGNLIKWIDFFFLIDELTNGAKTVLITIISKVWPQ